MAEQQLDLSKPIDAKAEVSISQDKYTAYLKITQPFNGGRPMSMEGINAALAAAGIRAGIDNAALARIVSEPQYGVFEVIARGLPVREGKAGEILYKFTTSSEKKPVMLQDGSVDFKQLGIVHNVRKGDKLCRKIPATQGTPGVTVRGESVNPKKIQDINLPMGKNTSITPDGLELVAEIDGQVELVNRRVEVLNTFEVRGDVDVSSGNIYFVGNVVVNGNVLTGFNVKADGNVTIRGVIEGGTVESGGNVLVLGGFNGMNQGKIKAVGDVHCKYIQQGRVNAGNNIETAMCMNSTLAAGGSVRIIGSNSGALSSHVIAQHSIECVEVGSKTSFHSTTLEVGTDPEIIKRRQELPGLIAELRKSLETIDRALSLFNQFEQVGRLTEDKRESRIKLEVTKRLQMGQLVDMQNEIAGIEERLDSSERGIITISGKVYEGTVIIIGLFKMKLDSDYQFVRFYKGENGVEFGTAG